MESHHLVDDRLAELRDIMPTLLEMAGAPIPDTVEGISLVSPQRRTHLYGEFLEGASASRMLTGGRHKLIYYPAGNHTQLFDLETDPDELTDLSHHPSHQEALARLTDQLISELYGTDTTWINNGTLEGLPDQPHEPGPDRGIVGQRGWRFT